MYGRRFHALKISYLKNQIDNMIGGYFGTKRGEPVVYITYDPTDPSINSQKKRVYKITSKMGMVMARLVEEYMSLKREYDALCKEWVDTYNAPIPSANSTFIPNHGIHKMNYNFWEKAEEYKNNYPYRKKLFYNGKTFRSKNEIFVAQELDKMKIPYKIEPELIFSDTSFVYPDLLIGVKEIDKAAYIEVMGGAGMDDYNSRNGSKLLKYQQDGYRDMRDIITIKLGDDMDVVYIHHTLVAALELMSLRVSH